MAIIHVAIFLKTLFLLLVKGLFIVSAGAYSIKQINVIIHIAILTGKVIVIFDISNGIPTNISIDENKQVEDLFACIPKAGYLIILKNISVKINSLNIPSKNASGKIIRNFPKVRYIPSSPYLSSSSCISILLLLTKEIQLFKNLSFISYLSCCFNNTIKK